MPRAALDAQIGNRKLWVAASTHDGEEEVLVLTHARIREQHPDALLIIVPRHPERGAAVSALAQGAPRRSLDEPIGDAPIYVADTMGEMGLFYSVAPAAFIAGSLKPHLKGHNPIEPVKLGAPVIAGPFVESFEDIYDALSDAGAAVRAGEPEDISEAVIALWADPALRKQRTEAAKAVLARGGAALNATIAHLCALLPPAPIDPPGEPKTADASA